MTCIRALLMSTCLLLLCSQIAVCQKNNKNRPTNDEKILEIIYDRGGGDAGFFIRAQIKQDSTFYLANQYNGKLSPHLKKLNTKTSTANWNMLINILNLTEFDKMPSGPNERQVDGNDTQVYIKTSKKTHFLIVDYSNLKNYASVNHFITELTDQLKVIDRESIQSK